MLWHVIVYLFLHFLYILSIFGLPEQLAEMLPEMSLSAESLFDLEALAHHLAEEKGKQRA